MKETTKLVLMALGAGVAANYLLAPSVASATASQPMVAAGAEGIVALGGGYWAWKTKSKAGAIIGGIGAGLLVSSIQGGLLTAPAPPPQKQMGSGAETGGAAPKSMPTGSTLPAGGYVPAPPTSVTNIPGLGTIAKGEVPGSSIPNPNRPPNAAEIAAHDQYMQQQAENMRLAMAQQAQALQQGSLPGPNYVPPEQYDASGVPQSGAALRMNGSRPASPFGAGFRRPSLYSR